MTSRVANGNDLLRLLLLPALAVGLAVGCSPAKGSGGENSGGSSGQSSGGNSGQTGGSKSGGTTSASGGNNNPSGGTTSASGGNNNPSGGTTSASGGNNNPSGGTTSASGGNNNPSGGTTSASGGNNNPSGGTTTSSGGSRSGGTTSGSGGNNNPSGGNKSGGTTSATGGNNNPSGGTTTSSGGTTTSSGGTNPSGGTTSSTGGSTVNPGTNPPGWWQTSDWGVTSANWHGCVWTGVDCKSNCSAGIVAVPSSTTSITPTDFTAATTEGGPYEVSGTVFNDYNSVALLGFDLTDTPNGDTQQCSNAKRNPAADGPPAVAMPSGKTGIAINWSAKIAPVTSFRIQIQGVKGATDPTNRWCATITDASGPSFVKFSDFYPSCWNVGTANSPGTAYAGQPIDAVVFLVPGTITAKAPFDFTIVGFAPGTSVADAPGKVAACGTTTGTVGSTTQLSGQASIDAATQRAAVTGTDCKKYIINNNNWGNESGTYQSLSYTGNSFTDTVTSGSGGGANVVSFPSIYIGANGQIGGGTFNTWSDSGLPKPISGIKSAQSTFKWSGGSSGGNYNAAYDIWFAKNQPTPGSYNDAVSGFIMIWLYKPGSSQPIGSSGNTRSATIGGQQYDVWRGPRVGAATGTDGNGRPVISYVAKSTTNNFSADLKAFFDDAVANASADMSAGGTSQAFANSWYLTDVFAGFEIWNGGDAKGLQDTFTCVIQ